VKKAANWRLDMLLAAMDIFAVTAGVLILLYIIAVPRPHLNFFFLIWLWVLSGFIYFMGRTNEISVIGVILSILAGMMFAVVNTIMRFAFGRHRW
jgi:hypothetical protein